LLDTDGFGDHGHTNSKKRPAMSMFGNWSFEKLNEEEEKLNEEEEKLLLVKPKKEENN